MDGRGVGSAPDQPVKGVDFAHEMALAEPTDGGIAGHRPDAFTGEADQCGRRAHARRNSRSLATGMASAHHNDIKCLRHSAAHSPSGFAGQNLPVPRPVPRGTIICRYRIFQTDRQAYLRCLHDP